MIKIYGTIGILVAMTVGWFVLTPRSNQAKSASPTMNIGGNAPIQELPTFVRVAKAESFKLDRSVDVTGTIIAKNEISIASKILGKVGKVLADEGENVPAGKILVQLEPNDWQAQVRQARANLEVARERLQQAEQATLRTAKIKLSQSEETLSMTRPQVNAEVKQAEAKLALDQSKLKQAQTQLEATRIETGESIAKAQAGLDGAKTRLALLKAGGREEEKKQAAAQVASARASYEEARRNAERYAMLFKDDAVAQADVDLANTKLETAKSQLDSALQQQAIVLKGARSEELEIAGNQIKEAAAQMAIAVNNKKKIDLAEHEVHALQDQVRHSQAALEVAQAARMQVPMRELDVETAGTMVRLTEHDVAALRASVDLAKANLDLQTNNLKATAIRAPIPGRLTRRSVEPGEIASTGKVVFTLVNDEMVYFAAKVAERDLSLVSLGAKVPLTIDAFPDKTFQGAVAEVLAAGDVNSRYFTVKIALPNKSGSIKQGMFARGRIVAATVPNAVMIPSEAVMRSGDRYEVAVVKDDKAERIPVILGVRQRERVHVVSGVSAGDLVVTSGQEQLRPGSKVTITNSPDASGPVDKQEVAINRGRPDQDKAKSSITR